MEEDPTQTTVRTVPETEETTASRAVFTITVQRVVFNNRNNSGEGRQGGRFGGNQDHQNNRGDRQNRQNNNGDRSQGRFNNGENRSRSFGDNRQQSRFGGKNEGRGDSRREQEINLKAPIWNSLEKDSRKANRENKKKDSRRDEYQNQSRRPNQGGRRQTQRIPKALQLQKTFLPSKGREEGRSKRDYSSRENDNP